MDIQEVWDKLISTIKSYPGVNPSQLDAFSLAFKSRQLVLVLSCSPRARHS